MMIETCRPRKFRKRFGGRVRAFEAVDWGAEGVEKELMRICREKLVVLKEVLVRMSGEERNRKGDDLLEKMRVATNGGGGMMREIFGVLRSGDPGGVATAQAPLNAVYVADDKEGTAVSGPGGGA